MRHFMCTQGLQSIKRAAFATETSDEVRSKHQFIGQLRILNKNLTGK